MGVTIKGLDKLVSQLNAVPEAITKATASATVELTEHIAGKAVSNVQSNFRYSSGGGGGLAEGIASEVETDDGVINGAIFNPIQHSLYTEFGTGPNGEASVGDLPEGVNPVYTQEPWLIPDSEVGVDLNERYGIPIWMIKGEKFYFTHGQIARPWLHPAYVEGMEDAEEIYQDHINRALKGVAK